MDPAPSPTLPSRVSLAEAWLGMWIAPRLTTRRLLSAGAGGAWPVLAALLGISQALDQAANRDAGARLGPWAIVGLSALVGTLAGPAFVFLYGLALRWTGSWLGGVGNVWQVRAALAWGQVPAITGMPLWIPVVLAGGAAVFRDRPEIADPVAQGTVLACGFAMAGAALWGAVTSVLAVAEAHRFSAWRALGAGLLAAVVLALPVAALGALVVYLVRSM